MSESINIVGGNGIRVTVNPGSTRVELDLDTLVQLIRNNYGSYAMGQVIDALFSQAACQQKIQDIPYNMVFINNLVSNQYFLSALREQIAKEAEKEEDGKPSIPRVISPLPEPNSSRWDELV